MESGEAHLGLICVHGSPTQYEDVIFPADRVGKWDGWVDPDLEAYQRVCMR